MILPQKVENYTTFTIPGNFTIEFLLILPIDKLCEVWYNGISARHASERADEYLYIRMNKNTPSLTTSGGGAWSA